MTSVGDGRRRPAIQNDADHAWRPPRRVPLQLDEDEQIAGKQQGRPDDLAAMRRPWLTKAGDIDFIAGLAETKLSEPSACGWSCAAAQNAMEAPTPLAERGTPQ